MLDTTPCWYFRGNELADQAAKFALRGWNINILLPLTDFRPIIKWYVRKQGSAFWSLQLENKYHRVQPALGYSVWSCRKRRLEVEVLCRFRIRHLFLTHGYLLAGEDPPRCIPCQKHLTADHILLYTTTSENTITTQVLGKSILLNFLREAGLSF